MNDATTFFELLRAGEFFKVLSKPQYLMRKENAMTALTWKWDGVAPLCGFYRRVQSFQRVKVVKAYKVSAGVFGFKKPAPKKKKASGEKLEKIKAVKKEIEAMKMESSPGDGSRWDEI